MANKEALTPQTSIQRNEGKFLASALGEEIVMMNTDNGDYIGVNNVGSDIWNMLDKPITVESLIKSTLLMYDISEEEGTLQINEFLERMIKHDMLIILDN